MSHSSLKKKKAGHKIPPETQDSQQYSNPGPVEHTLQQPVSSLQR